MGRSGLLVFNQNYQLLIVLPERHNDPKRSPDKETNTKSDGKRDLDLCTNRDLLE